jgi:hypothetical protein
MQSRPIVFSKRQNIWLNERTRATAEGWRDGKTHSSYLPLAFLDVPALGQSETFIQVKEDLFDEGGNIANENSKKFLQGWMNRYAKWVKKLTA